MSVLIEVLGGKLSKRENSPKLGASFTLTWWNASIDILTCTKLPVPVLHPWSDEAMIYHNSCLLLNNFKKIDPNRIKSNPFRKNSYFSGQSLLVYIMYRINLDRPAVVQWPSLQLPEWRQCEPSTINQICLKTTDVIHYQCTTFNQWMQILTCKQLYEK